MTRDEIVARLTGHVPGRRSSVRRPSSGRSDFDLDPAGRPREERTLRSAGVLVPLIDRSDGVTVLLTQRTAHLQKHAGQISFPGGGHEPQDPDLVATALRETEEEIGLPPAHVDVLGRLDLYETSTAYGVVPVVGWIQPPFPLKIDPFEVADVFEVPLSFVLDPSNHRRDSVVRDGRSRSFYVLPYEDRYIWGATAGMLVNLYEVLRD